MLVIATGFAVCYGLDQLSWGAMTDTQPGKALPVDVSLLQLHGEQFSDETSGCIELKRINPFPDLGSRSPDVSLSKQSLPPSPSPPTASQAASGRGCSSSHSLHLHRSVRPV